MSDAELEKTVVKIGISSLAKEELKAAKLPPGTSAQIDQDGKYTVLSKPSADALKSARGAKEIKAAQ